MRTCSNLLILSESTWRENALMAPSVQKILFANRFAEPVIVLDKGGDEFVQADLENFIRRCVFETCQYVTRLGLRGAHAAVCIANRVEETDNIVVAGDQGARHFFL